MTIYDAEQIGGEVGLCMEFVDGPTLELRVQQHGPLPSDEAVAAGVQLCDAVAAVHGAGVLHRDIKAANAVIKADGTVVLMDFGAGQSVEGDPLRGVTGTPLYLAPEVLDGEQATVRSDIYSLGVLLHYVLTGAYPVTATSLSELRLAHRRRTDAWESGRHRLDSRIPSSLRPLLERALDPKPERRQERVTALAEELRGLQRAGGARRWRLRHAAALIVAAVGAGAFLTGLGESSQPERLAILPFAVSGGGVDTHVYRDWAAAEADYRHAIAIAPNNVLALQEYAHWLSLHGRFEEALKHAEAAQLLDPLSPRAIIARASVLRFARRYDEALAETLKALDINPLYAAAQANAGHCYEGLGRMNEAIAAFQRWQSGGNLAHVYGRSGRVREARALITLLEEKYAREGVSAGEVAQGYIGLGELDRAFEWLERMGHRWPTTLKVAAVWDPLRSDPRFKRLLQQRGLDR